MARVNPTENAPFYAATQRFVEAALRADDSIFTPGQPIWTSANLDDLYDRFVVNPDVGGGNFVSKFQQQLAGAPPAVYQLAGELLFVHLLIAAWTIGYHAKRDVVTTVLNWSPQPIELPAAADAALQHGLAKVGIAYLTYRPFQLAFLITFVRAWKTQPRPIQDEMLDLPWDFKAFVFGLPIKTAYGQREAILHIVHPDTFEAIVSRAHKRTFAADEKYAPYLSAPSGDVDRDLLTIRQGYEHEHGTSLNFYGLQHTATAPLATLLPRSLGTALRPYVQVAAYLRGDHYTPDEIVDEIGRISPPPAQLNGRPDATTVVRDLLHLRLLEPLADGTYRRWSHLADATVDTMLRYAALTLLVPDGAGNYTLPVLRAPFDGLPHVVADWPHGDMLLAWYHEANVVEQLPDGAWRSTPGALEPLAAQTPTARALHTFLEHVRRVQRSQRDLPPLADEPLAILDPATLDTRIAEIQRELLIDRLTLLRIYRALIAGQHVILSGPPGTGKTHLARLLPHVLWRDTEPTVVLDMPTDPQRPPTDPPAETPLERHGYDAEVVTATEDWGVRQVIGGIVPTLESNGTTRSLVYTVRHGHLTRTVLANYAGYDGTQVPALNPPQRQEIGNGDGRRYRGRWLVIDEFTRAPIDAAFGGLLTTLGGQRTPLAVPTDTGDDRAVPLPRDFRIIGTLNSFDRHFLNQISEAMKRRFTFIDVLPPDGELQLVEQGMTIYRALLRLREHGLDDDISVDATQGNVVWDDVVSVTRAEQAASARTQIRYAVVFEGREAAQAVGDFWRIYRAIRLYRQLGTAQAESVLAALFTGQISGMTWSEALDAALADVLADQLQVLHRDEQRVLLWFLANAATPAAFNAEVRRIVANTTDVRQAAQLATLRAAGATVTGDTPADQISSLDLAPALDLGTPLLIAGDGLFARRVRTFVDERGL